MLKRKTYRTKRLIIRPYLESDYETWFDAYVNRLEVAINLDHVRSIRLARSIGMRREGIKGRYIYENSKWTDHIVYVANPEDIGLKANKPI